MVIESPSEFADVASATRYRASPSSSPLRACVDRVLRVHHFERRRLARLIAKHRQAQDSPSPDPRSSRSESSCACAPLRLRVSRRHIALKRLLRQRQIELRLIPPQLRLLDFAACRAPVPHRNVQRGLRHVSQILPRSPDVRRAAPGAASGAGESRTDSRRCRRKNRCPATADTRSAPPRRRSPASAMLALATLRSGLVGPPAIAPPPSWAAPRADCRSSITVNSALKSGKISTPSAILAFSMASFRVLQIALPLLQIESAP